MRKRYAREIRQGILLARRTYPYYTLWSYAPETHTLLARAHDRAWYRLYGEDPHSTSDK